MASQAVHQTARTALGCALVELKADPAGIRGASQADLHESCRVPGFAAISSRLRTSRRIARLTASAEADASSSTRSPRSRTPPRRPGISGWPAAPARADGVVGTGAAVPESAWPAAAGARRRCAGMVRPTHHRCTAAAVANSTSASTTITQPGSRAAAPSRPPPMANSALLTRPMVAARPTASRRRWRRRSAGRREQPVVVEGGQQDERGHVGGPSHQVGAQCLLGEAVALGGAGVAQLAEEHGRAHQQHQRAEGGHGADPHVLVDGCCRAGRPRRRPRRWR